MKEKSTRQQIAALPVRLDRNGRLEVCLITSRNTGRWIIPKGWTMRGLADHEAAAVEALEEAGLQGKMLRRSIGSYNYWQRTQSDFRFIEIAIFIMRVKKQNKRWKEDGERSHTWLHLFEAADCIQEPELSSSIIRSPSDQRVCRFIGKGQEIYF